jgi:hypothetical protein
MSPSMSTYSPAQTAHTIQASQSPSPFASLPTLQVLYGTHATDAHSSYSAQFVAPIDSQQHTLSVK